MKSVRVFVATVLFALTVGTVAGTAAADTGSADYTTTASATPGDDSGWGRIAG
ncbi:hypothetical protein ACFU9Y_10075 [Streptomyces sp. NPDC057621]|uniref:Uncharacterized protein n=1 Tax=Streptomyces liliiviolaceus TaxID=2823109 RepID=A0A940Y4D0_9ACTN|nr:hypothetical protein [Streptomyces liliiviolaceus]MBQ0852801.1 hypothetical protein [Streptomyces liliiviolaceus]